MLEPLNGYLLLAEKLYNGKNDFAEPWNFGPNFSGAISVGSLADLMCETWGNNISWITENNKNKNKETKILRLDSSKAQLNLRWKPKLSIKQTVQLTLSWYKAFLEGTDMYKYSVDQIRYYEKLISRPY